MGSMNDHLSQTPEAEKDLAQTPWPIIREIEKHLGVQFILDACASRMTKKAPYYYGVDSFNGGCPIADDGLTADWRTDLARLASPLNSRSWDRPLLPAVYCNPPFSMASDFIKKCAEQAAKGCIVVGCFKDAGDPEWYQVMERTAAFLIKFDGRIEYLRPSGNRYTRIDKKSGQEVNSGVNFASVYPVWLPFRAEGLAPTIRLVRPKHYLDGQHE